MKVYVFKRKTMYKIAAIIIIIACFAILPKPSFDKLVETATKAKRKVPIYCVETDKKQIAISFDAAWGADDTDDLLAILHKHDIKATFFLVGDWVKKYPEEVKRIYAAGHDIGNHSNKHPDMTKLSREQIKNQLMDAHQRVKDLINVDMELFRPPFGAYNDALIEVAKECGYYVIQWDVDSLDWKEYGTKPLIDKVLNHKSLGNGSIILFHNNAKYTKDALDTILTGLEEKGYKIVPISQLIIRDNYYIDHIGRQKVKTD